jgi:hypothetical protein
MGIRPQSQWAFAYRVSLARENEDPSPIGPI